MTDRFGVAAPPQAPVIEGVLTGISVTNEGLSEVGPLELRGCWPWPPHAETLPNPDIHKAVTWFSPVKTVNMAV